MRTYICSQCGTDGEDPHGCDCGGENIPSDPLPDDAAEDAFWNEQEERWDDEEPEWSPDEVVLWHQ